MAPRDKYSDPQLRDEVKEEIHASDKGGKPGQWSARKAQMMASEYKKRGGGYNTTKKGQDSSQKHLDQWTKEDWQTKEGSGTARKGDDSRKRYLPKKAWEQMSDKQKEETEEKKVEASKKGKQYVGNTKPAKEARKEARKEASEGDKPRRSTRNSEGQSEKPVGSDHGLDTGDSAEELVKGDDQDQRDGQRLAGTKRRAKQSNASVKKQKDDLQKTAEEDGENDEEEYKEEHGDDEEDE